MAVGMDLLSYLRKLIFKLHQGSDPTTSMQGQSQTLALGPLLKPKLRTLKLLQGFSACTRMLLNLNNPCKRYLRRKGPSATYQKKGSVAYALLITLYRADDALC
ncbi:hypothetical protein AAC387_Pa11g0561 [Persea americana]